MTQLLGMKKKKVNQMKSAIRVCCTARKLSGQGCGQGMGICPFLKNGLCEQPARVHSGISLVETTPN